MRSKWFFAVSILALFSVGTVLAESHYVSAPRQTTTNPTASPSASPPATPAASASPAAATYLFAYNNDTAANIIHHTNELEIEEAQAALYRLQTAVGLQVAQTILTDGQNSENQLIAAVNASTTGVALYAFQPATYEVAADAQLSLVADADYDNAFLQNELSGSQRALNELQLASNFGQVLDSGITQQVSSQITLVQSHIALITAAQNGTLPSPTPSASASATPSPSASASPSASSSHR